MPFYYKAALLAVVLSCSASAISQCSNVAGSQPALSLKLAPVNNNVTLGDPVLVNATLTNVSDHDISVWRAPGFDYSVDVRDEKKNLAPDTELGRYRNGHADVSKMRPAIGIPRK